MAPSKFAALSRSTAVFAFWRALESIDFCDGPRCLFSRSVSVLKITIGVAPAISEMPSAGAPGRREGDVWEELSIPLFVVISGSSYCWRDRIRVDKSKGESLPVCDMEILLGRSIPMSDSSKALWRSTFGVMSEGSETKEEGAEGTVSMERVGNPPILGAVNGSVSAAKVVISGRTIFVVFSDGGGICGVAEAEPWTPLVEDS